MEDSTDNNTSVLSRPKLTSADGNNNDDDEAAPEESSWTMYFEDFFKDNSNAAASGVRTTVDGEDDCDCYLRRENSSLISDAASCVGMKKINVPKEQEPSMPKKRKCTDVPLVGHDLEDTASSPSSSPNNVHSMMNLLGNNKRDKAAGDTGHEKGDISGEDEGGLPIDDLKKKGLCLVPLSMFANYLE